MSTKASALWTRIKPALFGAVGAVTLLNGGVAVLAFLKDVLTAMLFGTSVQADALTLAYFLPDTIGNNMLAAALGTACVPLFSKLVAANERVRLRAAVTRALRRYIGVSAVMTIALYLGDSWVADRMAGGSGSELDKRMLTLMQIMLPMMALFPAITVGGSLLQAGRRFVPPAAISLVPHFMAIAALGLSFAFALRADPASWLLAYAMLAGVAAMVLFTWRSVKRSGLLEVNLNSSDKGETSRNVTAKTAPLHANNTVLGRGVQEERANSRSDIREITVLFIPYLLIIGCSQSVYFVERLLASSLSEGTIAGLNYAFRLAQFPIWVFVAAVYSVALPTLARDSALGDTARLEATMGRALRDILIVTVPTTILFALLRGPIVAALFQRGAFDAVSVRITSDVLAGFALTIAPQAVSAICLRYFLAAGRVVLPLAACAASAALNIAADILLAARIGAAGLGYGAALGAVVNAALLLTLLARQDGFTGRKALHTVIKILAANVAPALLLFCFAVYGRHSALFQGGAADIRTEMLRIGYVGAVIAAVAAVYAAGLYKLNLLGRSGRPS